MLTTLAAVSSERVTNACGEDPGWICRRVLNWTGDDALAEAADFIIGKPLAIVAILIAAVVINRLARRSMKGALRTLQSGAVKERLGALRNATPDALLETSTLR